MTSDHPMFHTYVKQISGIFLNPAKVLTNTINKFLVLLHQDESADLYVNDFRVVSEVILKRDRKSGDIITSGDILDIQRIKFPDIQIKETDRIIFCFQAGWRFGLFFNLTREPLDLNQTEILIGNLYRSLEFYDLYKVVESTPESKKLIKDGWFPFLEIIPKEYEELISTYGSEINYRAGIDEVVKKFSKERISEITQKWWRNQIFADKKTLIEAGLNAYLSENNDGVINCIKNLTTEIEGILRRHHLLETTRGNDIKINQLTEQIYQKAKYKTGSDYSLFLPSYFKNYLTDYFFAKFDIEKNDRPLSRHSSSHGVAEPEQYTKEKALQLILILDQIYFFIS
jgi:hypothetical protein